MDDAPTPPPNTADALRSIAIVASVVLAIIAGAWGSGVWGGAPVGELAGGALDSDATLLAPASAAFTIWSVIYAGLIAFAVFHAWPGNAGTPRLRATAWLVASASVLSAAWVALTQAELLWLGNVAIAGIVAALALAAKRLALDPPQTWPMRLAIDVPVGLFLGWVCVALVAGITAAGAAAIPDHQPGDGVAVAALVLVAVAVLAVLLPRWLRGSPPVGIATGLALSWGLWWIAQARLQDEPASTLVGWCAGLAAAIAFGAPFAIRDFSMIGKNDPLAPR
jgi:hypothetical protein